MFRFLSQIVEEFHNHGEEEEHHDDHHEDHGHDDHGGAETSYTSSSSSSSSSSLPWGDVILASILVQLVTLAGLLLAVASKCSTRLRETSLIYRIVIPALAAGALLATAAFLLLPESLKLLAQQDVGHLGEEEEGHLDHMNNEFEDHHYYNETAEEHEEHEHEEHSEHSLHGDESFVWKFGASLLGGFLLPVVLSLLFPTPNVAECQECLEEEQQEQEAQGHNLSPAAVKMGVLEEEDGEDEEEEDKEEDDDKNRRGTLVHADSVNRTMEEGCDAGECDHSHNHDREEQGGRGSHKKELVVEQSTKHHTLNIPLAASILVGDAFHNFTDGVFIGTAFLLCSREVGYTLVATTIYHELAQELADYVLLTHHCGLAIWKALLSNFIAGFSVMIGGVLVLALDLSQQAIGIVLAVSAGVYLYITAVECIPKILQATASKPKETLGFFLCFVLGAVPIGLVLLSHGHCEA